MPEQPPGNRYETEFPDFAKADSGEIKAPKIQPKNLKQEKAPAEEKTPLPPDPEEYKKAWKKKFTEELESGRTPDLLTRGQKQFENMKGPDIEDRIRLYDEARIEITAEFWRKAHEKYRAEKEEKAKRQEAKKAPKAQKAGPEKSEVFDILRAPLNEQREKLDEFKIKHAEQKRGMAVAYNNVIFQIRENPDAYDEHVKYLKAELKKSGASAGQETIAENAYNKYREKHEAVKSAREKYPDDKALFTACFGKAPKGEIEVVEGPMTFYFKCQNAEDFAYIRSGAFVKGRPLNGHDMEAAELSHGVSVAGSRIGNLKGCLIAENSSNIGKEYKNAEGSEAKAKFTEAASTMMRLHEEQHAISRLFEDESYTEPLYKKLNTVRSQEERERLFVSLLRQMRRNIIEPEVKQELLAYYRSGEKREATVHWLTERAKDGGSYDFWDNYLSDFKNFPKELLHILRKKNMEKAFERAEKVVFIDEYKKMITDRLNNLEFLESKGYPRNAVIGFLINEPLSKWPKVVGRLVEAKRLRENMREAA